MTSPDIRPSGAPVGDPTPNGEIPLQERGERVSKMIADFKEVLLNVPDFGKSLALESFSNVDTKSSKPLMDGVYFRRGNARYILRYVASVSPLSSNDRNQALSIDVYNTRVHQRVVLSEATEDGKYTRAIANNYRFAEGSLSNLNTSVAFERNQAVLDMLKGRPQTPSRRRR